jgi:hypothetical protein
MMNIDGHWETVETLHDVSRMIREYYNYELADKLDELISEIEDNNSSYVRELEDTIDAIRNLVW